MFRRALSAAQHQQPLQQQLSFALAGGAAALLSTSLRHGATQLESMPSSTTRKPRGMHRGPNTRQVSPQERAWYRYVRRWELEMENAWDDAEKYAHLPKPKKLIGNEACEVVWPYAVLLENVIKIHPFAKSLYCYYPQHALSEEGANAAHLARRFSRECMIPITFHNSQCYVETEMLLEHGDTAWIVVHCLDGRHEIVCVNKVLDDLKKQYRKEKNGGAVETTQDAEKAALLGAVLACASSLGASAKNPSDLMLQLNTRPLQNSFVRVDYQWMGDTAEERQAHLVRWVDPDERGVQPMMYQRDERVLEWLNAQGDRGTDQSLGTQPHLYKTRTGESAATSQRQKAAALSSQYQRYSRLSPLWGGRGAGGVKKVM
jgi:hypothetical protein